MTDVIKVLVADDQALVRGGLVAMLNLETDLRVVAEVSSGDEVLAAATDAHPSGRRSRSPLPCPVRRNPAA